MFVDESRCFPKIDEIQSADSATLLNIFAQMNEHMTQQCARSFGLIRLSTGSRSYLNYRFFLINEAFWPRSYPTLTYMVNFIYLHYIYVYILLHSSDFLSQIEN